jgi:hypothetical protein
MTVDHEQRHARRLLRQEWDVRIAQHTDPRVTKRMQPEPPGVGGDAYGHAAPEGVRDRRADLRMAVGIAGQPQDITVGAGHEVCDGARVLQSHQSWKVGG